MNKQKKVLGSRHEQGFAMLLTLVVVSVVLAIGLSILDTTLKQLILSGTARDSELAFHAAYAGAECAQFARLQDTYSNAVLAGGAPTISCLNVGALAPVISPPPSHTTTTGGTVHRVSYETTWGSTNDMCTEFDLYLLDATTAAGDINNVVTTTYGNVRCNDGNVCTLIISRGYNRGCNSLNTLRAIQREVVVKY